MEKLQENLQEIFKATPNTQALDIKQVQTHPKGSAKNGHPKFVI